MKRLLLLLLITLPLGVWATSTLHIKFIDGSEINYRAHEYWTDFIIKEGYQLWNNLPSAHYYGGQMGLKNDACICIADCSVSSFHEDYYKDYESLNEQPFNANYHYLSPERSADSDRPRLPTGHWWYLRLKTDEVEPISVD